MPLLKAPTAVLFQAMPPTIFRGSETVGCKAPKYVIVHIGTTQRGERLDACSQIAGLNVQHGREVECGSVRVSCRQIDVIDEEGTNRRRDRQSSDAESISRIATERRPGEIVRQAQDPEPQGC